MKSILKWIFVAAFLIVLVFFLAYISTKKSAWTSDVQVGSLSKEVLPISQSVSQLPLAQNPSPQVQTETQNIPDNGIKYVKIAGKTLKVDLALTPETQEQGLSGRSGLKENEGMLFVFDKPSIYPFWMKDMNFPIDMIWIGENDEVVYIEKNAQPDSYPETFVSSQNAKYVLEVISSFSEKNNLKVGDRVEFLSS